jgi:hypothetical protein
MAWRGSWCWSLQIALGGGCGDMAWGFLQIRTEDGQSMPAVCQYKYFGPPTQRACCCQVHSIRAKMSFKTELFINGKVRGHCYSERHD